MPYRFTTADSDAETGMRRIAREQMEKGLAELDDGSLDLHKTVHQLRKRCKKLRGLVRLVRPGLDGYARENAAFRDAARGLSALRDRQTLIDTYEILVERRGVNARRFAPVRRRLVALRDDAAVQPQVREALDAMRQALEAGLDRAGDWRLDMSGRKALRKGLKKTFGRARKAMAQAQDSRAPEDLHEWRKRVKYHLYHARLMSEIFEPPMAGHRDAVNRLADLLGDHHDRAVFCDELDSPRLQSVPEAERRALAGHARQAQTELEAKAVSLGARLFAEPKGALADRWSIWWQVWRRAA